MRARTAGITARRLARYTALAPAIASPAFAAIHGASGLNHEIGFGGTAGAGGVLFQIGGENVTFDTRTSGSKRRVAAFVSNADFRVLELRSRAFYNNGAATVSLRGTWGGGLPVAAGATFGNPGRNTASFPGNNGRSFKTLNRGTLNFSNTRADWASRFDPNFVKDPQGLGDTGQTWYLLFKFWGGDNANTYGWISFDAFVDPASQNDSIVVTGWGWDDSGAALAAGIGPVAVPGGTGLAALAFGAAGLRGRRRSRQG
jgi:hypothetical protein